MSRSRSRSRGIYIYVSNVSKRKINIQSQPSFTQYYDDPSKKKRKKLRPGKMADSAKEVRRQPRQELGRRGPGKLECRFLSKNTKSAPVCVHAGPVTEGWDWLFGCVAKLIKYSVTTTHRTHRTVTVTVTVASTSPTARGALAFQKTQ